MTDDVVKFQYFQKLVNGVLFKKQSYISFVGWVFSVTLPLARSNDTGDHIIFKDD